MNMLSRVADSIYWMSRYLERAENVARFIDVNLHLSLDLGDSMREQWEPLVFITGDHEPFRKRYQTPTKKNVIDFLTFDRENPNSILSCLAAARENARTVREIVSSEMWEEINKFYLKIRGSATGGWSHDFPSDFFDDVRRSSHLIIGVTESTMSHGESWHFAQLGRLLERADKTSRILDVKYYILLPHPQDVGTPLDVVQWSALLKSVSGLEMYRRRCGRITPEHVVEFLVLDREFPRSMHSCLLEGENSLRAITGSAEGTFRNLAEQRLGRLRSELNYSAVTDIIHQGLHEFVDGFQIKLNHVGDAITETFFAPRPVAALRQSQFQLQGRLQ